jgi:hypothetical protein
MPKTTGDEPTQETHPKVEPPVQLPIPTRGEFFRSLDKVANPRRMDSAPDDETGEAENTSRP